MRGGVSAKEGTLEAAGDQLRQRRAMGRQFQVKHALGIARTFLGNLGVTFQQGHLPAACRQAGGAGAAGQPGADHQCLTLCGAVAGPRVPGLLRRCRLPSEMAAQDLPFRPPAGDALHLEADCAQPATDEAGAGEGAEGGAWRGQPRHLGEQFRLPHLRVLRRREAIEKPGIDACVQLRQALQRVADQQCERDAPIAEPELLEPGVDRHVLRQQPLRQLVQLRP